MSAPACVAWAINALVWGVILVAQGVQYSPITRVAIWLLGGAFLMLVIAWFHDWEQSHDQDDDTL